MTNSSDCSNNSHRPTHHRTSIGDKYEEVHLQTGAGPYLRGGGYGFNPPNVEKKNFGNVKKHAQRNASADALYVCTIVIPGKAIWRL